MARKIYTQERIDYLRKITPGKHNDEITRLFNEKFGTNSTEEAIRTIRQKNGIHITIPRRDRQYTQEHLDYLQELSDQGLFNKEITEKFNDRFGTTKTEIAIRNMRAKHGIKTSARNHFKKGAVPWNKGRKGVSYEGSKATQFRPGNKPHTWVPVGTKAFDADGYLKVKVADPDKWRYKHRMIWEQVNGPIPEGAAIIFGDGDKSNFDPNNLLLATRAQLLRMNQLGLIHDDKDLTKIGIVIADIHNKMGERKRDVAGKNNRGGV